MKKHVSLVLLAVLTPLVFLSHVTWSKTENGLLFNIDGRDVDLAGMIQDKWRKATNSCSLVHQLNSSDSRHHQIKLLIQSYSPPDSMSINHINVWVNDTWAIAEVEFIHLLPAVVTIKNIDQTPVIVDDAIWSGFTKPWIAGPLVRAYLSKSKSKAPQILLDCFELQTKSLAS
jgi:hypothetical protein